MDAPTATRRRVTGSTEGHSPWAICARDRGRSRQPPTRNRGNDDRSGPPVRRGMMGRPGDLMTRRQVAPATEDAPGRTRSRRAILAAADDGAARREMSTRTPAAEDMPGYVQLLREAIGGFTACAAADDGRQGVHQAYPRRGARRGIHLLAATIGGGPVVIRRLGRPGSLETALDRRRAGGHTA